MSEPYTPLCARWEHGQAVYDPAGLPVVFDRAALPLGVYIDLTSHALADAVVEAMRMWNREIGLAVFKRVPHPDHAQVEVVQGSATDGGMAATRHTGDVVPTAATIELRQVGSVSDALWAASHELGHVLGLRDGQQGCMGDMPEDFDSSRHHCLPRAEEIDYLRAVYKR